MAGKTRISGRAGVAHAGYFPSKIFGVSTAGFGKGWEAAKGLFNHRKAEDALRGALPFADERLAIALFIAGGLLAFVLSMLTNIEMLYVLQLEASIYQELVAEEIAVPDLSALVPVGLVNFIVYVPFMAIVNVAFERLAFIIARATGGKGRLGEQMLLSSVVWLAIAITTAINLIAPIGIFWVLSLGVIFAVGLLYLMIYMVAKAYSMAHGISMAHAITINILLVIPKLVILFYGSQVAVAMLGASLEGV